MLSNKTQIRVRYADTDQMQFVYNGKYLEYFEVGRTEMLREIDLPYNKIETEGLQLPVLETYVKYLRPAFYDDILTIHAFVKEIPQFKIHIEYEIFRNDEPEVIAEGFTEHVFIKKDTKKAIRIPAFFLNKMKEFFSND